MPSRTIQLEEALQLRDSGALFVDVRSPSEFAEATIPGAINIPIFDDEERARVGTLYKQEGKDVARKLGIKMVSPKIPDLIDAVETARGSKDRAVIVFCWRGGMRSRTVQTLLELAGVQARQLVGGHKIFRDHVRRFFEEGSWGRMIVLRGLTGVGKTRILERLEKDGLPVIDLEGLANHRGSAFGGLGLPDQPTQKAFESELWDRLRHIPPGAYAVTEGESKSIGRIRQPIRFYQSLQVERSIWVEASLDTRVRIILEDYPAVEEQRETFKEPIMALKSRLGRKKVEEMLGLLARGEWKELVRELMVCYYDPLYSHTKPERRIEVSMDPFEEGLVRLKEGIEEVLSGPSSG